MFDAALIQQCADPGLEIAIAERFIMEVGSDDPLKVTITQGNRVILPEIPPTSDGVLRVIAHFVGQANVRVGITQYPAGYGISDASEVSPAIIDPCENIRMGTALFGKVYRIVTEQSDGTGSVFLTAIKAWQAGFLGDNYVFAMPDPGPSKDVTDELSAKESDPDPPDIHEKSPSAPSQSTDPNQAGIRIDLSRIPSVAE